MVPDMVLQSIKNSFLLLSNDAEQRVLKDVGVS